MWSRSSRGSGKFGRFLEAMVSLAMFETAASEAAEGLFVADCPVMVRTCSTCRVYQKDGGRVSALDGQL
jgi:hypothetical protein